MKVTVFGGSTPEPGERAYEEAYDLGKALALAGHSVLTGGYSGTMEAVSRGAAEMGGHTIGITCDEIDDFRPGGANQWVLEERRYPTLKSRMYALIELCDAAIALPGGVGTLSEIAAMWNQIQVGATEERPLIAVGKVWRNFLGTWLIEQRSYVTEEHGKLLKFVDEAADALKLLEPE
jgi:hypothetical protein